MILQNQVSLYSLNNVYSCRRYIYPPVYVTFPDFLIIPLYILNKKSFYQFYSLFYFFGSLMHESQFLVSFHRHLTDFYCVLTLITLTQILIIKTTHINYKASIVVTALFLNFDSSNQTFEVLYPTALKQ